MTAASTPQRAKGSRVLQYYKPLSLSEESNVSVSGLDLSHDGNELLVSYESDQIYTFPVFPSSQSPRRAATDQLEELLSKDSEVEEDNQEEKLYPWGHGKRVLPELAAYGSHLNRFTFLKNARYAGPRDEYICTGSDSGHAWVYEKATGAVVSFWKADNSTCNGVVPHPTLPIFMTYGIESTAKLWRASTPVDSNVDDSAIGRRKHFRATQERCYKMTPTVRDWGEVQSIMTRLSSRETTGIDGVEPNIYPDQIPPTRGRSAQIWFGEISKRSGISKIGNDLQNLPDALKRNSCAVLRSLFEDDDVPVESNTDDFKKRLSLIRLRHQADSLGLTWNPTIPWMMEGQSSLSKDLDDKLHPSELVPEYPSDWIPFDADMGSDPFDFEDYFCGNSNGLYNDFYRDRYYALDERGIVLTVSGDIEGGNKKKENKVDIDGNEKDNEAEIQEKGDLSDTSDALLGETVRILKDGGNDAFKAGKLGLAAYRYDKAIQYGSVAYMDSRKSNLRQFDGLLKNLVMTRLNMALIMLNSRFMELQVAMKQSKLALKEVSPFCDPKVIKNKKELDEALALKAKACFRLGSAQYEMGDYSDSIQSLEESLKCTHDISNPSENKPDSLVLRRLAQAKREQLKHTKRQRKKFKFAFTPQSSLKEEKQSGEAVASTKTPQVSELETAPSTAQPSTTITGESSSINVANNITPLSSPALEVQTRMAPNAGAPSLPETEENLS